MVHVRGVNVFPSAIAEVLAGFSTDLTGEFQIVLDAPPPYDLLKIEAETSESRSTQAPAVDLGDRVAAALHEQLNFRADIELVPCGALPRTEGKAIRVVKSYT